MKNKLLLTIAVLASVLDARAHRRTNAVALGNAAQPPAAPEPPSELELLRKENAELKAAKEAATADETLIRQKMAAGLSRPQAVAVVARAKKFAEKLKPLAEQTKKNRAEMEARNKRK